MPFYFRKSVKAGPFRFNFSKSGIGVSTGIKGFRVGSGPRGHYIQAGRGGIYYRATLKPQATKHNRASYNRHTHSEYLPIPPPQTAPHDGVEMIEIESGDVSAMTSVAFEDVLAEINKKSKQLRMARALPIAAISFWLILVFKVDMSLAAGLVATLIAWSVGIWLDSFKRSTVLMYDLEPSFNELYQSVIQAFDGMAASDSKWHIEAGGAVRDRTTWKRNAGASHIVRKSNTELTYKLPSIVKSNITPPVMHVGRQVLYFFPDLLLVEDGSKYGAIGYPQLRLRAEPSNFIEEGRIPRDAQIISHTWKHPNKGGGPDRRFSNNYQIPVCRYEALHLSSVSGLNELVEFSRVGVASAFAKVIRALPQNLHAISSG